jgi:hypothetical protein
MTGRVVLLVSSEQTLAGAAAAFLAQPSLARSTRRSYDQTLTRLVHELGGGRAPAAAVLAPAAPPRGPRHRPHPRHRVPRSINAVGRRPPRA